MNTPEGNPKTAAETMATLRDRMVKNGIKLLDFADPAVLAEYQRQARALGESDPAGDEIQPFLDAAFEELWNDKEWTA